MVSPVPDATSLQALLGQAINLHQQGQLAEADALYAQVLALAPRLLGPLGSTLVPSPAGSPWPGITSPQRLLGGDRMVIPQVRWCMFELRVPLDREVLLRVSLGLRALPGVAVVRVQPETGRIAVGAAPGFSFSAMNRGRVSPPLTSIDSE